MRDLVDKPLVLVVDNSRAVTGALNAMRHATGPLRPGLDFEYVLPTGSTGRATLEADGYRVHELPFVEISRRKADLLRYVPLLLLNGWRLRQLARRQGAQVVHLNDFYNLTGYVAKGLSLGKLRVVTHVRFLPQSLPQPLAARGGGWPSTGPTGWCACRKPCASTLAEGSRWRSSTTRCPGPSGTRPLRTRPGPTARCSACT
ncbi:hypothetical protein [Hymenobacter coccineus]|uniref:hypothetical protein n=1 Tax=Hymenobacter coccineus TaxID=1908235 RepID=UPI000F7A20A7|nr:hypothetical protein [Hymenobacter coccineus]